MMVDLDVAIVSLLFAKETGELKCGELKGVIEVLKQLSRNPHDHIGKDSEQKTEAWIEKDDTVRRQAAIDAINHICPVDTEYDCTLLDRVDVRYVLSDLPSAEPKKGRWDLHKSGALFICSACGDTSLVTSRFCPNCGAKMEGVTDARFE